VRGCRDVTAADMVRNDVRASVDVAPDGSWVEVDGERVGIGPVDEVALSWRYLLG
jgi:urease subunit alpha